MPRLGQVAHFSAKGDRNAHAQMTDALENRGYALWLACQGKIKTNKAKLTTGPADRGVGDVQGYEIEVNLKRKCFDLWPGLNQMDKASQESYISEIYAYLRQSGNAICVRRPGIGEHGIPLWWLRKDWNDVKAVGIYRTTELTSREKRLTPQEAGEDREPAPVSVKHVADNIAAASEKAKVDPREAIIAVIKASPQPLYQREIAEAIGLTSQTCGRILRDLKAEGKIFAREESRGERPADASGRYRILYWHKAKVPLRKTPLDLGNQTMERVWEMKPGESLKTSWMSPGNKLRVKEMVENGLLEYVNEGTADERIRLAPATESLERPAAEPEEELVDLGAPVPVPEPAKPMPTGEQLMAGVMGLAPVTPAPPVPAPAPPAPVAAAVKPDPTLAELGALVADLIEREVERRLAEDTGELDRHKARIRELEQKLIDARAELSAANRELDEIKPKWTTLQAMFGK